MMSTDWDSLLQDVEIRYSKLAEIDGLLVIDMVNHDDMTWRRFPRYWPFVRGIYRSTVVDYPHKEASNMGLWCLPEHDLELTIKWPVIWDAMTLMWCYCNMCATTLELKNPWELNLMSRNLAESEIWKFTKNGMCSKSWDGNA